MSADVVVTTSELQKIWLKYELKEPPIRLKMTKWQPNFVNPVMKFILTWFMFKYPTQHEQTKHIGSHAVVGFFIFTF